MLEKKKIGRVGGFFYIYIFYVEELYHNYQMYMYLDLAL